MEGFEPTHPKELIYSQPPLSNLAASPLILAKATCFPIKPLTERLLCPHLFQRIVLAVVSAYLGALLCIALTVA